jgi:hypothetical protein
MKGCFHVEHPRYPLRVDPAGWDKFLDDVAFPWLGGAFGATFYAIFFTGLLFAYLECGHIVAAISVAALLNAELRFFFLAADFYQELPRPGRMADYVCYPKLLDSPLTWSPRSTIEARRFWFLAGPSIAMYCVTWPSLCFAARVPHHFEWWPLLIPLFAIPLVFGLNCLYLWLRTSNKPWHLPDLAHIQKELVGCGIRGIYIGNAGPYEAPLVIEEDILKDAGAVIIGPMGSGKTATLEAITEALVINYQSCKHVSGNKELPLAIVNIDPKRTASWYATASIAAKKLDVPFIQMTNRSGLFTWCCDLIGELNRLFATAWEKADFSVSAMNKAHGPGYGRSYFWACMLAAIVRAFESWAVKGKGINSHGIPAPPPPNAQNQGKRPQQYCIPGTIEDLIWRLSELAEGRDPDNPKKEYRETAEINFAWEALNRLPVYQIREGSRVFSWEDVVRKGAVVHLVDSAVMGRATIMSHFTIQLALLAAYCLRAIDEGYTPNVWAFIDEQQFIIAGDFLPNLAVQCRFLGIHVIATTHSTDTLRDDDGKDLSYLAESLPRLQIKRAPVSREELANVRDTSGTKTAWRRSYSNTSGQKGMITSEGWTEQEEPRLKDNAILESASVKLGGTVRVMFPEALSKIAATWQTLKGVYGYDAEEFERRKAVQWPKDNRPTQQPATTVNTTINPNPHII